MTDSKNDYEEVPKKECKLCGEEDWADCFFNGDPGTDYEGEEMCESCYFGGDPVATIVDSAGFEYEITDTRNDTEGRFKAMWHSTDPWRGFYELESDQMVPLHNDVALWGSEDERELANFDEALQQCLDQLGIDYWRAFLRTSNVFSMGYEVWIDRNDEEQAQMVVETLKEVYRDPARFRMTALTGKDPQDFTDEDYMLGIISKILGL